MKRLLALVLIAGFVLSSAARCQTDREISSKEQELQKLRNEIEAFEQKLVENEKRERLTLERLDNMEVQSTLIRKLVRNLRQEEERITSEIDSALRSIDDLERQLAFLKSHYAQYVTSVYKNGRVYDVELLFSSKSVNQLLIRLEYMKRFSNQRAEDLRGILDKKRLLEDQNTELQTKLTKERQLISEKTKEERSLKQKVSQRQRMLTQIRKDKGIYRKELDRKNKAVREIEQLIADLIEKERKEKARDALARAERGTPPPVRDASLTYFGKKRGSLRWPVSTGSIASRYGRQIHPVLKTVTQNAGIDISVKLGSDVHAVADGEVSILKFIPGFGNVLILDHNDGYRSVYAHLSEIHVSEAQRVREGDRIGVSGDSIAGDILHFEIWKDRQNQNPELWLVRQR